MRAVHKSFGSVAALQGVEFNVLPGEVHALIGENGAGKSTLMRILSGALRPDSGKMEIDGVPFAPDGPLAARDAGVAMIYQELNLAPHLSVEANLMLGRERDFLGFQRRRSMRRDVERVLQTLEHTEIAPTQRVDELGLSDRQLVEVARALMGNARIVVMDEPTSSLARPDTERLFHIVRRLREQGVSKNHCPIRPRPPMTSTRRPAPVPLAATWSCSCTVSEDSTRRSSSFSASSAGSPSSCASSRVRRTTSRSCP